MAHPAPSVLHDYQVSLTPTGLTVESFLRVSPELVAEVYRGIDTDGDGKTSQDETEAWFHNHPSKLKVALDDKDLKLNISQAPPISKEDLLTSIDHPIHWTYTSNWTEPISGKHRILLTYGDNYIGFDEYYLSVANDTANDSHPANITRAQYPASYQVVYHIPTPQEANNVPKGEMALPPYYDTAPTPAPTAQASPTPVVVLAPAGGQGSMVGGILDSIRGWHGDLGTGMGLLLLALLIGALHALTPGHGKTMVAAYLVGSRGRPLDAVILGGVVTFTHTVGVVVLGLVLLLVSSFTVPRGLQPGIELVAGLIVVGLGLYLLVSRWRQAQQTRQAQTEVHTNGRNGAGKKEGSSVTQVASTRKLATAGASSASAATQTLPVRPVSTAAKASENGHVHNGHAGGTTEHAHTHTHTHDGHTHPHSHDLPAGRPHLASLIGLGVSGGMVPCPDALAILLLAASVGQFALGLGLVLSFGLGLAAVLIFIGVVLVSARGALERSRLAGFTSNPLWTRWVPIASAVVVLVIGGVMTVTALGALGA